MGYRQQFQTTDGGTTVPVDSNNPLPISKLKKVTAEFTRPADTIDYSANDVISNSTSSPTVMTFSAVTRGNGQCGYIVKARLMSDSLAPSTVSAVFKLHLFHTSPTAINDNAPYTMMYANRDKRIGVLTFPAAATEGSGSDACHARISTDVLAFCTDSSSNVLYGILETATVFTPASAQNFYVELLIDQC
jgi:hypothetical protein